MMHRKIRVFHARVLESGNSQAAHGHLFGHLGGFHDFETATMTKNRERKM